MEAGIPHATKFHCSAHPFFTLGDWGISSFLDLLTPWLPLYTMWCFWPSSSLGLQPLALFSKTQRKSFHFWHKFHCMFGYLNSFENTWTNGWEEERKLITSFFASHNCFIPLHISFSFLLLEQGKEYLPASPGVSLPSQFTDPFHSTSYEGMSSSSPTRKKPTTGQLANLAWPDSDWVSTRLQVLSPFHLIFSKHAPAGLFLSIP